MAIRSEKGSLHRQDCPHSGPVVTYLDLHKEVPQVLLKGWDVLV